MIRFRFILFVVFLTCTAKSVYADCAGGFVTVWPRDTFMCTNGIIMIEGSFEKKDLVSGMGSKYPVRLISGNESVMLRVFETHKSEYGLLQILLKADKPLKPGLDYYLVIDSLPFLEKPPMKYDYNKRQAVPYHWRIRNTADTKSAAWIIKPAVSRKTYVQYGCGPEMHVYFRYSVTEASPFLLRTTITDPESKIKYTYCVEASDTSVAIGRDMCNGEFVLKQNVIYEATFDIIDASGNVTPWIGKPILFTAANKETD